MSRMLAASLLTPLALAAVLAATPCIATAQTVADPAETRSEAEPTSRWEWLVPSGTVVPAAADRGAITRGHLTAIQVSYRARPNLAVTSTAGWIPQPRPLGCRLTETRRVHLRPRRRAPRSRDRGPEERLRQAICRSRRRGAELQLSEPRRRRHPQSRSLRGRRRRHRHPRRAGPPRGARLRHRRHGTRRPGPVEHRNDVVVMAGLRFTRR